MKRTERKFVLMLIAVTILLVGGVVGGADLSDGSSDLSAAVDYADADNWLSVPTSIDYQVDVFYLYPTAWYKTEENEANVCAIDHSIMRKLAPLAYARQATAFEPVANIFAPYYRQAEGEYLLSLSPEDREATGEAISVADATAAFEYYIEYYNEGRPFILAGHSQGSIVLKQLLAGYLAEHPAVYERMVAAYLIGYSVTPEYFAENPHLKFAERADDTGVIISYNTEAPGVEAENGVVLPGALVINPITWTTDETYVPAAQSLGSIRLNKDGTVVVDEQGKPVCAKNYADAQIDSERGVLLCSTADVDTLAPGNSLFGRGIFHSFDYPFYYFNLRENARVRAEAYLRVNP